MLDSIEPIMCDSNDVVSLFFFVADLLVVYVISARKIKTHYTQQNRLRQKVRIGNSQGVSRYSL